MTGLLILMFLFICGMILARVLVTDSLVHVFLLWNIFLAWIPFILSRYLQLYQKKEAWKQVVLFFTWLVFFPNALYLVTDLIHIRDRTGAPVWYDAILLFTCALLGLIMAYWSLMRIEKYLAGLVGRSFMPVLMILLIGVSAFGVYLGRFDRWNSWDVVHNPLALIEGVIEYIRDPVENGRTWVITLIFSVFFYLLYLLSKWFGRLASEIEAE